MTPRDADLPEWLQLQREATTMLRRYRAYTHNGNDVAAHRYMQLATACITRAVDITTPPQGGPFE